MVCEAAQNIQRSVMIEARRQTKLQYSEGGQAHCDLPWRRRRTSSIAINTMAPVGNLSRSQLAAYNGSDPSKPLLVAVKGNIYDVTSAPNFYGKGGNYHCLTGRDASRALGRMSLERPDLESSVLGDLTSEQIAKLNEWEAKFRSKYPVVGKLM